MGLRERTEHKVGQGCIEKHNKKIVKMIQYAEMQNKERENSNILFILETFTKWNKLFLILILQKNPCAIIIQNKKRIDP